MARKRILSAGNLTARFLLSCNRDADYLDADPWFAGLREDPRFRSLLEQMRKLQH